MFLCLAYCTDPLCQLLTQHTDAYSRLLALYADGSATDEAKQRAFRDVQMKQGAYAEQVHARFTALMQQHQESAASKVRLFFP